MSYNTRTNQLNAYRETRVRTAGQGQMIVMLYDEAIKQMDIAAELLDEKTLKLDKVHNAIVKAQDCITELTAGLDFEQGGELASSLYTLYRYFHRELTESNIAKDPDRLRRVRRLVNELRGAWNQITSSRPQASTRAGYGGTNQHTDTGGNINFSG